MEQGERFNSITHLIGALAALVGGPWLVVAAAWQGDARKVVGFAIYATTLLFMYTSSVLYHSLGDPLKRLFRKLDHLSIYLLIAGTYTPLTLITLGGGWGWSLFGVIWGLTLLGFVLEFLSHNPRRAFALPIYLLMGWLALLPLGPLVRALHWSGFAWLLAGGLFYTVGTLFYLFDHKVRHFHGIWHLFVLAGSLCHYLLMYRFVL